MASSQSLAGTVVAALGGKQNIEDVRVCASRVRFRVKDFDKIDVAGLSAVEGVKKAVRIDGEVQLIAGKASRGIYEAVSEELGLTSAPAPMAKAAPASVGVAAEASKPEPAPAKKPLRTRALGFLQELGKTFMFPVSTLAFMGLLVGLGSSLTAPAMTEQFPFLQNEVVNFIFSFMNTIGGFGFTYLPVMFAMAVPFGLSNRNKGVGAIAAFAGYVSMNLAINFVLGYRGELAATEDMKLQGQSMVLGIQTIEMGVVGGVIVGLIVYNLLKRFQDIKLPDAFSFFGGIRFVPIISVLVMALVGLVVPFVWPVINMGIHGMGVAIQSAGVFGPFLYGLGVLILKPFGMHHILLALVRFTDAGGTQIVNGQAISGALNIFYAQLNAGLPISPDATAFLSQGFMPTFMFGLPAICLAIYLTARKENRPAIKGILLSATAVAIVTGISEPTEFLFLFIALPLYVFHAIMSGLALMVMSLIGVCIGNTDGGILDWIIFGIMQGSYTKWWLVIPVGIVWFAIYFFVFRWYILKFNVPTPGREENGGRALTKGNGIYDPAIILEALGGADNIVTLDNCVTRLRLNLKDVSVVDKDTIKRAGALAVVELDKHNLQVVIGAQVQSVKTGIEKLMGGVSA